MPQAQALARKASSVDSRSFSGLVRPARVGLGLVGVRLSSDRENSGAVRIRPAPAAVVFRRAREWV